MSRLELWFGVWVWEFGVEGWKLGFGVWGLGFGVWSLEFGAYSEGVEPRCSAEEGERCRGRRSRVLLEDGLETRVEKLVGREALRGCIPEEDLRGLIVVGFRV